jgi:hypothetical protein
MVGNLEVSGKFNGKCEKKGDILNLEIILKGNGNLHNADYPKLILPKGLMNYGTPKIAEDYTFNAKGCEGKITITYAIQSKNDEPKFIKRQAITYFDPEKVSYITLFIDGLTSKHTTSTAVNEPKGQTQVIQKKSAPTPKIKSEKKSNKSLPWMPIGLASLLAIGVTSSLLLRKNYTLNRNAKKTTSHSPANNWQDLDKESQRIIEIGSIEKWDNLLFKCICLKMGLTTSEFNKTELMASFESKFPHFDSSRLKEVFAKIEMEKYGMNHSDSSKNELANDVLSQFKKIKNA